jgi:uroporphyrinogen-III decarboxylase
LACDERIRLVLECSKAVRDYSDAVSMMGAFARSSDYEEYGKARKIAEYCRSVLKQARVALKGHIAEHGC